MAREPPIFCPVVSNPYFSCKSQMFTLISDTVPQKPKQSAENEKFNNLYYVIYHIAN